jgi:response regulator RpfG family c-di-GMP phosphodiesterase
MRKQWDADEPRVRRGAVARVREGETMVAETVIRMIQLDDKNFSTDLDRAGYRKMGMAFKVVQTYDELLKALDAGAADVVVLNLDYQKTDGYQVCRHLKSQEKYKAVPLVLISVQTQTRTRDLALEAGADLFIVQPLPREIFVERVKGLLDQRTRAEKRQRFSGTVEVRVDDKVMEFQIGDLSSTGVLLVTDKKLKDGLAVELRFEIPGNKKPVVAKGEVVRTVSASVAHPERLGGVGVRFVELMGDSGERLEKFLQETHMQDSRMQYYL